MRPREAGGVPPRLAARVAGTARARLRGAPGRTVVRVEVLDGPVATDAAQELVADMLAIVTCFAARFYGSPSQQFRRKVKDAAKEAEGLAG